MKNKRKVFMTKKIITLSLVLTLLLGIVAVDAASSTSGTGGTGGLTITRTSPEKTSGLTYKQGEQIKFIGESPWTYNPDNGFIFLGACGLTDRELDNPSALQSYGGIKESAFIYQGQIAIDYKTCTATVDTTNVEPGEYMFWMMLCYPDTNPKGNPGSNIRHDSYAYIYQSLTVTGEKVTPPVQTNPIDTASGWAKDNINKAIAAKLVPDYLQNNYTQNITRGEFCNMAIWYIDAKTGGNGAKFINDYIEKNNITVNEDVFSDTQDMSIIYANALGIVSGIGGGKFDPDGFITREQSATMLMRLQTAMGVNTSGSPNAGFADNAKISSWAVDGVNYVFANGIMNGVDNNNFDPQGTYTREQAIVTFVRIFGN